MLALNDDCAACDYEEANPGKRDHHLVHACARANKNLPQGDVGRCVRKDGGGWAFPPGTDFMEKKAVPKALNRPGCRGDSLLRQTQKHYKDTKGVYETTDAEGNIVHWAHEGSL